MGERGMNLWMWLAGRWERLIAVNALDEEEIRQGRLFNILMIISIVLVIFLVLLFLLMGPLGMAETTVGRIAAVFPLLFIPLSIFCMIQARRGRIRLGLPAVRMAVNLSLRQLADDHLIDDIKSALDDSGMAPNLLELEITESMVMHNPARMIAVLAKIKNLGVRLAIDDFGTGYSSLAQIKHFPIDTLKIDRSFIRNIPQDVEDKAITKAIIAMGKTLSLTVVAEGVETTDQLNFLQEHSCDEMQGFYFSKPIVAEQFADLLRKHIPSPLIRKDIYRPGI